MANRIINVGRIPLIPNPLAALKASAAVSEAIEQTDRAVEYKKGFFAPPAGILAALRRYGAMLDRATYMRDLFIMDDRELEQHGVRREEIPNLFFKYRSGDFQYRPQNVLAGDMER
jgi:hypothetical protein